MLYECRPIGEITTKDEARFRSNIAVTDSCHVWDGTQKKSGHGYFSMRSVYWQAHRIAYKLAYGADPGEQVVRHKCDNKWCVAPYHLELGTQADNVRDAFERGQLNTRGVNHPTHRLGRGVLTEDLVRKIRAMIASGIKQKDVAEAMSINKALVSKIVLGQRWAWVE